MGAAETVTALQPHLHQNLESDPNEAVGQRSRRTTSARYSWLIELGSLEYGMVTNSRMPSSYFSSLDWKNTPLRENAQRAADIIERLLLWIRRPQMHQLGDPATPATAAFCLRRPWWHTAIVGSCFHYELGRGRHEWPPLLIQVLYRDEDKAA